MSIHKHKALITISFTALLLGGLFVLFSIGNAKNWLEKQGLAFSGIETLKKTGKTGNATKYKRIAAITEDTAKINTLTDAERKRIDTLKQKIQFLENFASQSDNTALYHFFSALNKSSDSALHVWYYGDSQIEGDRITQDLRTMFQSRFGGRGIGYVPLSDVATYRSLELLPSGQLTYLNCFNTKRPKNYGFAGKVFRIDGKDSAATTETGFKMKSGIQYDKLYLLYGKTSENRISVRISDSVRNMVLPSTQTAGKLLITAAAKSGKVMFQLPKEVPVYGYLFESNKGVQIDNCGIRGHSGDGLKYISDEILRTQAKQLNSKLIIFHYGNNMIPYLKSPDLSYYEKSFLALFQRYRRLIPDASILIIGPGDMGYSNEGEEQSYPYIQDLVNMLRNCAIKTGSAFFDMYAYMRKDGGITAWKKRGYASLDGHLSPSGQKRFAEILYTEILREYDINNLIHLQP